MTSSKFLKNCSSEKTTRSAQAAPWLFSTLRDNTDQSLSAVRYHFKGKHPDQKGIHDHDVKAMRVYPFLVRVLSLEMIAHCRQRLVSVISKRTEQPRSSLGAARCLFRTAILQKLRARHVRIM